MCFTIDKAISKSIDKRALLESAAGKDVVLNVIRPGEFFGEIALLDGRQRTADAVATAGCEPIVIDRVKSLRSCATSRTSRSRSLKFFVRGCAGPARRSRAVHPLRPAFGHYLVPLV